MIISVESGNSVYHPKIVSGNCSCTFPFSHHVAVIECKVEPHFAIDDIVRVEDIFDGRIINIEVNDSTMSLLCRGHTQEMNHKYVTADYVQTGETSGDILGYLIETYMSRTTKGNMQGNGIANFDISKNKNNIYDVLKNLEVYDKDHRIVEETLYSNGKLSSFTLNWRALPTVSIIDLKKGARNVISYNFVDSGEKLRNKIYIFGNTVEDETSGVTTQYTGFAEDVVSQAKYGVREYPYADHAYDNDAMCQSVAQGIVDRDAWPKINGTVVITGALVKPGDYVHCEFPLWIEGNKISGLYRVTKVTHSLNPWITTISVGEFVKTTEDIIADAVNKHRLNNLNAII